MARIGTFASSSWMQVDATSTGTVAALALAFLPSLEAARKAALTFTVDGTAVTVTVEFRDESFESRSIRGEPRGVA